MSILHSQRLGTGKPLLILHGFLGMSDNWKTLGNRYAQLGFGVHLVDQRNHGRSFHSEDFDYDWLSKDIEAYCDHHGLEQVSILGHSMGGKTAMNTACRKPGLVNRLVVADIAPKYYPPHHQYIVDAMDALPLKTIRTREEADQSLSRFLPERSIRQFLLKNLYWEEPGKLGWRCNLQVLKDRLEEVGEPLPERAVFDGPALFIRGDRSEYVVDTDWKQIRQHFPEASDAVVQNAGHWLHAENPNSFFDQTSAFLHS